MSEIINLPTNVSDGQTGHLNSHQVIHAALKDHEARVGGAESGLQATKTAATQALSAANSVHSVATQAEAKATTALSTASNAVTRVAALEERDGVSPESPVDGQTANLLTQPHTLTHAAVKTFTDPIVCSLQPTTLRSVAETTTGSIYPLEVFDGYMWGFTLGGQIHRQLATGGEWSSYAQAPVPSTVIRILPTGDGEVLIASAKQVHKSSGWATGSPTWSLKVTANDTTNILRGGIAGSGSKFIVTSYASGEGFPESRYVYISLDAGNTWTIKYDSVVIHGQAAADGSHVHAVEYDPWADRFYISEGHSNTGDIGGLYASDDDGETWFRADGMKQDPAPVTVTATNDGLVCGSDNVDNGLFGVLRAPIPEEEMHLVAEWKTGALGLNGFARHAFREPETGLVYVAFRSNHPEVNPVIMAGSPLTGAIVYEFDPAEVSNEDRIESVVVPTPDRLFAHAISAGGVYTVISGKLGHPTARSVEDPGNVLGGEAGTNDSVVVGRMASSGPALRSVVIGRGATLPEGANAQQSVVIGEAASATGENSVTIGQGAKGTPYSIVIGQGADPGAVNSTVVIGYAASVSGGGQNVAIGRRSAARAQSVSVGDLAVSAASSSRSTAVGYSAKAGSDTIAVGANTNAGLSLRSVVLGAGANLSDTVGTQDHVVIGQGATSVGANSVVLGQGATGAESTVVIGRGVTASFPSTILIGQGSTVEGGGSSVAVGINTFARADSVAIGRDAASATSSARTVAVGYNAVSGTDSVAVGANTNAGVSLRSVVLGAGATLSSTTGTQNHVVIGQAATSTGADSVVVGQGATGAEASVIIGKGTSSEFPSVVLIGQGAAIDGGGNSVAVGMDTFARADSVAIGRGAASVATSARTVAVGRSAKAHTDSVALGASTETTQSFQVAVGARSLYVQDRAVVPAAPADGGQLYARDGALYWINSSGVSTQIAPIA